MSGADDPVGDFGKGIQKAYDAFWQNGIKAVQMKLYENDRHEILNETDYMTVYEDILDMDKGKLPKLPLSSLFMPPLVHSPTYKVKTDHLHDNRQNPRCRIGR